MSSLPSSTGGILSQEYIDLGPFASMVFDSQTVADTFMHCTFDWDGNTEIRCTSSAVEDGKELSLNGGWEKVKKVKINVKIANLPDPEDLPKTNDTFVLRLSEDGPEHEFKIVRTKNSNDKILEIEGADSNHP